MNYKHVSNCPRCGAPVYEMRDDTMVVDTRPGVANIPHWILDQNPPGVYFTCDCRKALPPALPDDVPTEPESTVAADARSISRSSESKDPRWLRGQSEAPSEERAE